MLMATPLSSTSIMLTWSQPTGEVVDSYLISYDYELRLCPGFGGNNVMRSTDGSARAFTLTRVEEDSEFTISIIARNAAADSLPAQITTHTPIDGRPYAFCTPDGSYL